jgi:hypothetical protein
MVGILGVRDLMKQSVIRFYLWQLSFLEKELREELHSDEAFSYAQNWPRWEKEIQVPIIRRFWQLFIVLLAVFPNLVLAMARPTLVRGRLLIDVRIRCVRL